MKRLNEKVIPGINGSWKTPMQAVLLRCSLELFREGLEFHVRVWVTVSSFLCKTGDIQQLQSVFVGGTEATCSGQPNHDKLLTRFLSDMKEHLWNMKWSIKIGQ